MDIKLPLNNFLQDSVNESFPAKLRITVEYNGKQFELQISDAPSAIIQRELKRFVPKINLSEEKKRKGTSKKISLFSPKDAMRKQKDDDDKKEVTIFTTPLISLMEKQRLVDPDECIPIFVRDTLKYIEAQGMDIEGIFRLSGSGPHVNMIRDMINNGERIDFTKPEVNPIMMSDLLGTYFRSLPNPPVPNSSYEDLINAIDLEDSVKVKKMKAIIEDMPQAHQDLLRETIGLLFKIQTKADINKMHADNISRAFGPNMIKVPEDMFGDDPADIMQFQVHLTKANLVIKYMIQEFDRLLMPHIRLLRVVEGHSDPINTVTLSPSHGELFSTDTAGNVKIWDMKTINKIVVQKQFQVKKDILSALCHHNKLWIGTKDSLEIWNFETGELVQSIPSAPVYSLLKNEKYMWIGTESGAQIWDAVVIAQVQVLDEKNCCTNLVAFEEFVCGSSGNSLIVWHSASPFQIYKRILSSHGSTIAKIVVVNNSLWTTAANDLVIRVWDTKTWTSVDSIGINSPVLDLVSFGPFVWACWPDIIKLYDTNNYQILDEIKEQRHLNVTGVTPIWSAGTWYAVSRTKDGLLGLWTVKDATLAKPFKAISADANIGRMAHRPGAKARPVHVVKVRKSALSARGPTQPDPDENTLCSPRDTPNTP